MTPSEVFSQLRLQTLVASLGPGNTLCTGVFACSPCRKNPHPRSSCEGVLSQKKKPQQCPCGREQQLLLVLLARLALLSSLRAALAQMEQNWARFHPSEPTKLSPEPAEGKEPQPSPKTTMNFSSQAWGGSVWFVLLFER